MKLGQMDMYVRSMGKALRVVAWFPDTDDGTREANQHMENHDEDAVVATCDGLILLANKYDTGVLIDDKPTH